MAHLRFPNSDKAPVTLGDKLVVGRSEEQSGLVIDDKRLSRKHCEFVNVGGTWIVRDLGSANGIRINGDAEKVKEHRLNDGDQVSLGGYLIEFHIGEPVAVRGRAVLRVIKGSLSRVTYPMTAATFTIGRKETCDLVLEGDAQASGVHARLQQSASGDWTIQDLGSTNGTKVDGRVIREAPLADGAQIAVGSVLLRFQRTDADQVSVDDLDMSDPDDIDLEAEDIKKTSKVTSNAKTEFIGAKTAAKTTLMAAAPSGSLDAEVEELDLGGGSDDDASEEPSESASKPQDSGAKVNTSGSGAGRGLVIGIEVAIAVIVLGAIGWFVLQVMNKTEGTGEGGGETRVRLAPKNGGGLLVDSITDGIGNYSFEPDASSVTSAGIPAWSTVESSPFDLVSPLPDDGKSGSQVLKIQRFQGTPQRTVIECQKFIDVTPGAGYTGSAWIRRASQSGGSAFLTMRWYTAKGEAAPIRTDSFGHTSGTDEWSELSATFVAPPGARAAKFGVGYAGQIGELLYDDTKLEAAENVRTATATAGVGALLRLESSGRMSVFSPQGQPMLTQGQFWLQSSSPNRQPLSHVDWMVAPPTITPDAWTFRVFDPDVEAIRTMSILPGASGFRLEVQSIEGSSYGTVFFRAFASQYLLPEDSSVAMFRNGQLQKWGTTLDSRDGVDLKITDSPSATALSVTGGFRMNSQTVEFPLASGSSAITIAFPGVSETVRELLGKVRRDGEEPVSNAERLAAGLALAPEGLLDADALNAAVEAVESVTTEWRIRQIELDDTVRAGSTSARDAQRFLLAVDEAEALLQIINEGLPAWRAAVPKLSELGRMPALPSERRNSFNRMVTAIRSVDATQAALTGTRNSGDAGAFLLRAERQRISAAPILASALDHFATAEPVQAQIKFESVIANYPHTRAATRARLRLLDLAAAQIAERDQHKALGLQGMAAEAALKARKMAELVRDSSIALLNDRALDRLKAGGARRPADIDDWEREQQEAVSRVNAMLDSLNRG